MEGYEPRTYGESFADVYDDWYAEITDVETTVAKLADLARGEAVLELGVGTGRLAVPLADRGLAVWGIDASAVMLAGIARRPGGDRVVAVQGDMADLDLGEAAPPFGMAFAAFNTFFNLTSRDAQARCLSKVAAALAPGGRLVIEAFVPADLAGRGGTDLGVHAIGMERVVLSAIRLDPERQTVSGQYVDITEQGIRLRPWVIRWALPDELDDLAREAGFRLVERSAGWGGEPFDETSKTHVSVYQRHEGNAPVARRRLDPGARSPHGREGNAPVARRGPDPGATGRQGGKGNAPVARPRPDPGPASQHRG